MGEFASAAAEGAQVAAGLRERSARLTAAATAAGTVSYEAVSDAGRHSEVSVTATGSGQVSRIYVGPQAMHSSPSELADTLSRLVNEAVHGARQRAAATLQEALTEAGESDFAAALQATMSAAEQLAGQMAEQTVSASSPRQNVTATANGAGEITLIEFGSTALRGDDNVTLAEEIAAAINAAFEAVHRLQDTLTSESPAKSASAPSGDLAEVLHQRVSAFNRQMDELDHRLDELSKDMADPS